MHVTSWGIQDFLEAFFMFFQNKIRYLLGSKKDLLSSSILLQYTVKPVLSGHSKIRPKKGFQDQLLFNAGQKYCRMLQGEQSAILSTFIKLPFVIKIFVLSIFEWPLKTGLTVVYVKANLFFN